MFNSHPIQGNVFLLSYGMALSLSLLLTFVTLLILRGNNALAHSVRKRVNTGKPGVVPFGGIAIIASFLTTLLVLGMMGKLHPEQVALVKIVGLGVGLMCVLGIVDDWIVASAWTKLAAQLVIGCLLYFYGFRIERIGDWLELGPFAIALTILWTVGISNSLNLIDGQDGLAGGIIFLSCLTLVFVYLGRQLYEASLISVILSGSILGFLLFNFPPAKIIMGDTGSLPLGLLMALVTMIPLCQGYTDEIYYLLPIVTLVVPITDTSSAFFRRILRGVSPFSRDAEHFHHRLGKIGLTPTRSILILLGIAVYFDLLSLVPVYHINLIPKFIPIFFFLVLLHLVGFIFWLRKKENQQNN